VLANDAPLLLDVSRLIWRRWAGRQPTGIDRVCLAYLEHFGPRAQAVVQHRRFRGILGRRTSAALFQLLGRPEKAFRTKFAAMVFRRLRSANNRGNDRLYLNLGHTGLDSDGFRKWVGKAAVRPVYFVHDLIPLTDPEFCRAGEADRHRARMRTVLSTAAGIIGNSEATLDELARFASAESLPCPPALAAWLGWTPIEPSPSRSPAPGRPTFVTLGTIEARKNHLLLLNIWKGLVARMGADAPRLLIIGQRGWEAEQVFNILDRDAALRDHLIELNHCADRELANHLDSARALVFPSKAEGYGLPLIEALALGVPVIASDLPVFREIGQGVPLLLDPADETSWEAAIFDFAQPKSAARAAQLQRLAGFRPPTWDDHFQRVEQWLATIGQPPADRGSIRSGS